MYVIYHMYIFCTQQTFPYHISNKNGNNAIRLQHPIFTYVNLEVNISAHWPSSLADLSFSHTFRQKAPASEVGAPHRTGNPGSATDYLTEYH